MYYVKIPALSCTSVPVLCNTFAVSLSVLVFVIQSVSVSVAFAIAFRTFCVHLLLVCSVQTNRVRIGAILCFKSDEVCI